MLSPIAGSGPTVLSPEAQMRRHRELLEEQDELLKVIRLMDGFLNFPQAVLFSNLQTAAEEGPIIVVNISKNRSDAIIIQAAGPPVLVALPDVLPDDLADLSAEIARAQIPTASQPSRRILPILRVLWEDAVGPMIFQLAQLGVEEGSRIWWCPIADPRRRSTRGQKNLPGLYVSSYTPP